MSVDQEELLTFGASTVDEPLPERSFPGKSPVLLSDKDRNILTPAEEASNLKGSKNIKKKKRVEKKHQITRFCGTHLTTK